GDRGRLGSGSSWPSRHLWRVGANAPDEHAGEVGVGGNSRVNAEREGGAVFVVGNGDDAGVVRHSGVEAGGIVAVFRQNSPPEFCGAGEHTTGSSAPARPSCGTVRMSYPSARRAVTRGPGKSSSA